MIRKNETMSKFKNTRNRQDDSNESLVDDMINCIFPYTIEYMGNEDWDVFFFNHFRLYKTI